MGMYTKFQAEIIVKEECVKSINQMIAKYNEFMKQQSEVVGASVEDVDFWESFSVYHYSDNPKIKQFARYIRADFIDIELVNNHLTVSGELKNYQGTIEVFIDTVLIEWIDRLVSMSSRYEEDNYSKIYKFEYGNFYFYKLED